MPAILAIDPGVSPTVCILYDDPGKLLAAEFYEGDETSYATVIAGKNRRRPSAPALFAILRESLSPIVVLEEVGVFPKEGAVGAFSFGRSLGLIEGLTAALQRRLILVKPQVWKKAVGIPAKAGKSISRHVASTLAPNLAPQFQRVCDHDRADAFLMAWWARSKVNDPA